jgi:hypothetical protein
MSTRRRRDVGSEGRWREGETERLVGCDKLATHEVFIARGGAASGGTPGTGREALAGMPTAFWLHNVPTSVGLHPWAEATCVCETPTDRDTRIVRFNWKSRFGTHAAGWGALDAHWMFG